MGPSRVMTHSRGLGDSSNALDEGRENNSSRPIPEVSLRRWMRHLQDEGASSRLGVAARVLKGLSTGRVISSREARTHLQMQFAQPPSLHSGTSSRPPLKWAGGKRWLVPYLRPIWEPYAEQRLVEPFVGGLAVTLGLTPKRALLNDINPHAVNFYRWLQKGLVVSEKLVNSADAFATNRKRFNELVRTGKGRTKEAAVLFYYLNRTCFNGLCRFNRADEFNVPFGSYKVIQDPNRFRRVRPGDEDLGFHLGGLCASPARTNGFRIRRPAVRRAIHELL